MAKLFTTLLVQIRKADAALIERGRPPRRGFELAVHPATPAAPRRAQRDGRAGAALPVNQGFERPVFPDISPAAVDNSP